MLFDDLDKETLSDDLIETTHPQLESIKRMQIKPWGIKKNGVEEATGETLSKNLKFSHVRADYIPTWFSTYQNGQN